MAVTKVPPRVGPCTPEEILDAAEWCFLHLGVAGTSTALIAARTRCARSLVSAHFPSPRSILQEVLYRGRLPLIGHLRRVKATQTQLIPALRSALQLCLNDILHNERVRATQEALLFHCDLRHLPKDVLEQQIKESAEAMALLRSIAVDAKRAGELRENICPESWASILGQLLSGAVRLCLMEHTEDARTEAWRTATRAMETAFLMAGPLQSGEEAALLKRDSSA